MNCSIHPNKEAVGKCPECGAALCYDCYNHTNLHYCPDCIASFIAQNKKTRLSCLVFGIVFAILFGVIMGIIFATTSTVGATVGMVIYSAMGGFAFGNSILFSRGQRKHWITVVAMAVVNLILGPIFFFIQLVSLIKLSKAIKTQKSLLYSWPQE